VTIQYDAVQICHKRILLTIHASFVIRQQSLGCAAAPPGLSAVQPAIGEWAHCFSRLSSGLHCGHFTRLRGTGVPPVWNRNGCRHCLKPPVAVPLFRPVGPTLPRQVATATESAASTFSSSSSYPHRAFGSGVFAIAMIESGR
jgi:hypothetical protein